MESNGCEAPSARSTLPSHATQATRTAEKIFQKYFGGDPWIGRESPVVSTDPRISRALTERGL
jgi:hypothetical protein